MVNLNKIIAIHGVPRSGTTWLGQIIDSSPKVRYKYQPLFSNSFKDRLFVRSTKDDMEKFFNELYRYKDEFLDRIKEKNIGINEEFANKISNPPVLAMKHVRYHYLISQILEKINKLYVVGIVRNPCAVLNSWQNAPKEFRDCDGDFNKEWEFAGKRNNFKPEEYFGFHKWIEATEMFIQMKKKYSNRFYLIQYENLRDMPLIETRNLFNFLSLEITDQTLNFIKKSTTEHSEDTYSTFKGKKTKNIWKKDLNPKIQKTIYNRLKDTKFEKYLSV